MTLGTTNISTTLVANTIELGSNDVGTLCSSSKINKWSRKKPVDLNSLFTSNYAEWWKGNIGNCDINVVPFAQWANGISPTTTFYNAMLRKNDSGIAIPDWTYIGPKGGMVSPYRLTDFAGYAHSPVLPVIRYAGDAMIGTDKWGLFFDFTRGGINRDITQVPAGAAYDANYGVVNGILSPSEITIKASDSETVNVGDLYPCVAFNGNIYISGITPTGLATLLYNGATKQFTNLADLGSSQPLTFNDAEMNAVPNKTGTSGFAVCVPRPTTITSYKFYPCLYKKAVWSGATLIESGRFFSLPTVGNKGTEILDPLSIIPENPTTGLVTVDIQMECNIADVDAVNIILQYQYYAQWNYVNGVLQEIGSENGEELYIDNMGSGVDDKFLYKNWIKDNPSWNCKIASVQLIKNGIALPIGTGYSEVSILPTFGNETYDNILDGSWWAGTGGFVNVDTASASIVIS